MGIQFLQTRTELCVIIKGRGDLKIGCMCPNLPLFLQICCLQSLMKNIHSIILDKVLLSQRAIETARSYDKCAPLSGEPKVACQLDKALVNIGSMFSTQVEGRVSTEVTPMRAIVILQMRFMHYSGLHSFHALQWFALCYNGLH